MISKSIAQVEKLDIEALINNKVPEGREIEYKRETFTNADSSRTKLLAGVSAMANTIGGDFLIGIEERNGIPVRIVGVSVNNPDSEARRFEQMLASGIEPRIPGLTIDPIEVGVDEFVFVVRTPKSMIGPHRVASNGQFYARNSKGKYQMDIHEIRNAMLVTDSYQRTARLFRSERIKRFYGLNQIPVNLEHGAKLVLHIAPLSVSGQSFVIRPREHYERCRMIMLLGGGATRGQVNIDGVLSFSNDGSALVNIYSQIFTSGQIEAVRVFRPRDDKSYVPIKGCEEMLIATIGECLEFYKDLFIAPPFAIFISLLHAQGYSLYVPNHPYLEHRPLMDRSEVLFPEVLIEGYEADIDVVMRTVFDSFWNTFGVHKSMSYDDTTGRRSVT